MYTKLNQTVELMNSDDFKDRFKAEYYQLKIRSDALYRTCGSMKEGTLKFEPKCSYELLYKQWIFMNEYLHILEDRAAVEGIEL